MVFFCGVAIGQPVSDDVAQRVAMNFVNRHTEKPASKATIRPTLRGDMSGLYQYPTKWVTVCWTGLEERS